MVDSYIPFLKSLVRNKHMSADKIIECMPSPELVIKDCKQLFDLEKKYRCYMGAGYPISYRMTESLAKDEDLEKTYGLKQAYCLNQSIIEEATFTTQEFVESVKKYKTKKL